MDLKGKIAGSAEMRNIDLIDMEAAPDRAPFLRADLLFKAPNPYQRYYASHCKWIGFHAGNERIGHACMGLKSWYKDTLLEFRLRPTAFRFSDICYDQLRTRYAFKQVICTLLDVLLFSIVSNRNYQVKPMGYLFHHDGPSDDSGKAKQDLEIKPATSDQASKVYQLLLRPSSRDFSLLYRGEEKAVSTSVDRGEIYIATREGQEAGLGFKIGLPFETDYADVGMIVFPEFRKQGVGTFIVNRMISLCQNQGLIPVATCSAENRESEATLKKCGFYPLVKIFKAIPPQS